MTDINASLVATATAGAAAILVGVAAIFSKPPSSSSPFSDEKTGNAAKDNNKRNEMFQRYAIGPSKAILSTGDTVTMPYHIYDGWSCVIYGVVDLQAATDVCKDEGYQPIQVKGGKHALGLISFWDFTVSNTEPHTEFQFTLLVTPKVDNDGVSQAPMIVPAKGGSESGSENKFLAVQTMTKDYPHVHMLIVEVYNNSKMVVAYNNELLALNAELAETNFDKATKTSFDVSVPNGEGTICSFQVEKMSDDLSALLGLIWNMGFSNFVKFAASKYVTTKMTSRVNGVPKSKLPTNITSLAFTKTKPAKIQWFDPSRHKLKIGDASHTLKNMGFQGHLVFHCEGVEFCYLCPMDTPITY